MCCHDDKCKGMTRQEEEEKTIFELHLWKAKSSEQSKAEEEIFCFSTSANIRNFH